MGVKNFIMKRFPFCKMKAKQKYREFILKKYINENILYVYLLLLRNFVFLFYNIYISLVFSVNTFRSLISKKDERTVFSIIASLFFSTYIYFTIRNRCVEVIRYCLSFRLASLAAT